LGVIGGNGAGKSTLLKVLSRITDPTEGYADIFGRVGSLLEVGTGMHPELTGRENIFVNGCVLGMRNAEIKRKFDEIVDFAGLDRFIDTPVKRYSSGMHVRLGFAIAAHLEPEILLIDEILAVGDAEFQRRCLAKVGEVAGEGRTVLFVSHNMAAVRALCGTAMLLQDGTGMFSGDTHTAIGLYTRQSGGARDTVPIAERSRGQDAPLSLEARIVGFDVIAGGVLNPPTLDTLEPADVDITIETDRDNCRCGAQFIIGDSVQNLVMCDSASFHGIVFRLKKGRTRIRCHVEPLRLAAGEYTITGVLCLPNQGLIDRLSDVYRFSVLACDPNSTGFSLLQAKRFAVFYVGHTWEQVE
jgi:lipopolysaccharide transport system ATP-binding protein